MSPAILLSALALAQAPGGEAFRVDPSALDGEPFRQGLPFEWRFRAGDDPAWAARNLEDGDWRRVSTLLKADEIPEDLERVGWFRLRLELPQALLGKPMMLAFPRVGALELYVDGERIGARGDVEGVLSGEGTTVGLRGEPLVLAFHRTDPQLAVRFASPDVRLASASGWPGGFFVYIGHAQEALRYRAEESVVMTQRYFLFMGFACALGLLHMLLFAFMPDRRGNLFYALTTFSVAALSFFVVYRTWTVPFSHFLWSGLGFSLALVALVVFGVQFLDEIVNPGGRRWRRFLFGVGGLLALGAWWVPVPVIYVYASIGLVEQVRIMIIGVRRRIRDLWIMGIGLVLASVLSLVQMLPLILGQDDLWLEDAYIYGFFALLASMSMYLARDFATLNASLARRVVEVRELSEATLAQERRAKSEEMRRVRLEEENKRQSVELEEAKKRQEVLTQLEATNRELRETQAQLVQSEKMASLGQLVAGIAHEINTPIGAVHSMHDSLEKASTKLRAILEAKAPELLEQDKKLAAMLKVMADATEVVGSGSARVAAIVQRLKTFARLDEADLLRADVHEGLEDTLLLLHHELKHGIEVVRDYSELPPIDCYPGLLNQVFLNLLVNAKQAIRAEGRIVVRTRAVGDHVHVSVEDNGAGIPPENLERIFDPGFTTKGVKVGTGLGLSICYRIVQQHRGEIRVESEVGRGTTFTVVLPTRLSAAEPGHP